MWIVIFIILSFVYFVFIRPVANPPIETAKKVYHFNNMAIFTQNGENKPSIGYVEVSFFNHAVIFKGQINDFCKIDRIDKAPKANIYCCIANGNAPVIIGDHFNDKEVYYFITENMGYRLF